MKIMKSFGLLSFLFLAINCKKNDDTITVVPDVIETPEPDPEPENRAPGSFTLLEVADEEINVNLRPNFSWNTSTDPDGDMIKYDLNLGKESDALEKVADDLSTATVTVEDRLSLMANYSWNVIAKDGKGKETTSETYSFTTRNLNIPENPENSDAVFSERKGHTVTFFNGEFWLIGGEEEDDEVKKDVFHSSNGVDWARAFGELPQARTGQTTLVFNDTLWVMGGRAFPADFTKRNQLYGTVDGVNFINGFNAPWSQRELHTSVVFQDKVWVLGGVDNDGKALNDVWSTDEVKTWDPNSESVANWSGRYGHSSIVFDDKLWVIGGRSENNRYLNEVWYTDGTTLSDGSLKWEFVPQENSFTARLNHKTVVYDNKMWIVGGFGESGTSTDIWYTEDGANWLMLNEYAEFNGRVSPAVTIFENKILMIGGFDGGQHRNDIWVFD